MEDQRLSDAFQTLDEEYRRRYGHGMLEHGKPHLPLLPDRTAPRMCARTATVLAAALVELRARLRRGLANSELHDDTVTLWSRAMTHESTVDDLLARVAKWVPGGLPK